MSITDELREWIDSIAWLDDGVSQKHKNILAIADRIDAEHEDAIKKLSADFESQLYCESFVNWAVADKLASNQRDIDQRVSALERKLNHKTGA